MKARKSHSAKCRLLPAVAAVALCCAFGPAARGQEVFKGRVCLAAENAAATGLSAAATTAVAAVAAVAAAEPCTAPHAKRSSRYVLADPDSKTAYLLEGRKARGFAGADAVVIGALDKGTGTIHINDMFLELPRKVTQAKSVYIDCDACPRTMAAAWRAAFEALADWGRFDVTPDPKKADLVLIFSANSYLGDYVTRDGPDTRPAHIEITYMDVVDPRTGQSLWADSRQWGSWRVASATKDLIGEFKTEVAFEDSFSKPGFATFH